MRHAPLLAFALTFAACGQAPAPTTDAPCDPGARACTIAHDFGVTTLAPGQEIDGRCVSWTLHNTEPLYVTTVSLDNDGGYHHSNWFYVPEELYDHPDGEWPCSSLMFDEVQAALTGGVLYAQSTQSQTGVQRFARGAALRIPPGSRVIAATHLLNARTSETRTGLRLTLGTVPAADAKILLTPIRLGYADLRIPPQATAEFAGRCDLRTAFADLRLPGSFQMDLYYVLPHYHQLGSQFLLSVAGGPNDGQELYRLQGGFGEPVGKSFDPPVALDQADGVYFGCSYKNPGQKQVGWGIGDQEMCETLGFVASPMGFDAWVRKAEAQGPSDGVFRFGGECQVTPFRSIR